MTTCRPRFSPRLSRARAFCLLNLALVVQRLDSAIHRINHYPVDSAISFPNTYPLDSDLSGGQHYRTFEQPGPEEKERLLAV